MGEGGKVAGVRLISKVDGGEKRAPGGRGVRVRGHRRPERARDRICASWTRLGFVKVDRNGLTSCPGLYAAGDVSDYELKQVVTACARGAFAAYHAAHYLETRALGA